MSFLSVVLGCMVGSFLGNACLFWAIGLMAQRAERKQARHIRELQDQFLESRKKEAERMERYAKMES